MINIIRDEYICPVMVTGVILALLARFQTIPMNPIVFIRIIIRKKFFNEKLNSILRIVGV
jgi:hypothetical protein